MAKNYQSINDDSSYPSSPPSSIYRQHPSDKQSPHHPLLWKQMKNKSPNTASAIADDEHTKNDKDHATQDELITAFYQAEEIRVPPHFKSLSAFYIFFLCLGIPIRSVRCNHRHLVHGHPKRQIIPPYGASPYPLKEHGSWWEWIQYPSYIYTTCAIMALMYYTTINIIHALHTSFRFLKTFFAVFFCLAVLSSVYLAHDILTRRLLGTRIYYALNNTGRPKMMHRWIHWTLYSQMMVCIIMALVGIAGDNAQLHARQQAFDAITNEKHAQYLLITMYQLSSVLVNLQFITGISIFTATCSMYLLRMNSCLRSLKRPGTTVQSALAQVFDIDVALADFSSLLNFPMSMLLVSCFLTFFCQSIFLSNNHKNPDEPNKSDMSEMLTVFFPGMVSAYILTGYSGVNNACTEVKLVAGRYATFEKLNELYRKIREADNKKDGIVNEEEEKEEKEQAERVNSRVDGKRSRRKKKSKKQTASSSNKKDDTHKIDMDESKSQSNTKALLKIREQEGSDSDSEEEHHDDQQQRKKVPSHDSEKKTLKQTAAQQKDEAESDDEEDILHVPIANTDLLSHCIDFLEDYLEKYSDVSLRLANFRVDQSLAWAFFLVATSTIFSLLDLEKLSFL